MAVKQSTNYAGGERLYFSSAVLSSGKELTISAFFKRDTYSSIQYIYGSGSGKVRFFLDSSQYCYLKVYNASSTLICQATIVDSKLNNYTDWHHIVVSVDLTSTSNRHVLIDGNAPDSSLTWNTYINDTIASGATPCYVASSGASSNDFLGSLSDLYICSEYIDLSITGNLRKLYSASGKPVWMGAHGELVTGTVPGGYFPDGGLADNFGSGASVSTFTGPPTRGEEPEVSTSRWRPGRQLDGVADGYTRSSDLSTNGDGKECTMSFWARRNGTGLDPIYHSTNGRFQVGFNSSNKMEVIGRNTTNSIILNMESDAITDTDLHHFLISFDMGTGDTTKKHIYIDNADALDAVNTYTNENIDWTQSAHAVGRNTVGTRFFDGMISQLWLAHSTSTVYAGFYLDITDGDNRAKFITSEGFAPMLGPDGSWPTGSSPLVYMPLPSSHNAGIGGDFVETGTPYETRGADATTEDPIVDNIQSGYKSITSVTFTDTVTITSVDLTRAVLLVSIESSNASPRYASITASLTNSTTITFQRYGATGIINVEWQVVEFSQGVSVQQGIYNNSQAGTNDVAISGVDLLRTIALATVRSSGTSYYSDYDIAAAILNASDNIDLYSQALDYGRNTAYQVVEFDNATVQKLTTELSTSSISTEQVLGYRTDPNKTWHAAHFDCDNTINNEDMSYCVLREGSLFFKRYETTGAPGVNAHTYVAEIGARFRNQHYEVTLEVSDADMTQNIAEVNQDNCFLMGGGLYGLWGTADWADSESGRNQWKWEFNSSIELLVERYVATAVEARNSVQVLEWMEEVSYDGWGYKRTITLDTTSSGSDVPDDQFSFPVLLKFDSSNHNFSQTDTNGEDIRFTLDDEVTNIDYEIERWDSTAEEAEVWVRVPTILGDGETTFVMWHGKSSQSSESSGPHVFLKNYGLVDHMADTTPVIDSTDSLTGSNTAGTKVDAEIGKGHEQDSYGDYREFSTIDKQRSYNMFEILEHFTMSIWMQPDQDLDTFGARQTIMSKGLNYALGSGYAQNWLFTIDNDGTPMIELRVDSSWKQIQLASSPGWVADTWYKIDAVWTRSTKTIEFFRNGASIGSDSETWTSVNNGEAVVVRVGRHYNLTDTSWFDGILDEARISYAARDANWIKLEYENQQATDTLVTYGTVEPLSVDYIRSINRGINIGINLGVERYEI